METIKVDQIKEITENIIDDNNEYIYNDIFDVAIIGGGFAGLSAALLLGRYLRTTIIFDVKETRKSLIHGYLGFEKTSREDLIQIAWHNVLQYDSIKRVENKVENIEKDTNNDLFLITTATAKSYVEGNNFDKIKNNVIRKNKARAKYLIICTGIKHIKPQIKNFEDYDGNGIWHCPHCDGFETANKKLIVIASDNENNKAIDYAKVFLGWTKDITLFIQQSFENKNDQTKCYLTDQQRNEARILGINVIENDGIAEIIGNSKTNTINGVISKSNKFFKADILFYHFEKKVQNEIAVKLGCELDEEYIKVDKNQQTTVPKVYAAGDVDIDRHYAILAAASGALAAISIYEDLLKQAIKTKKMENNF